MSLAFDAVSLVIGFAAGGAACAMVHLLMRNRIATDLAVLAGERGSPG